MRLTTCGRYAVTLVVAVACGVAFALALLALTHLVGTSA